MREPICARRHERGMTLLQVAVALGTQPSTVCRWEKRPSRVTLDNLRGLARVYGCSVSDLVDN